MANLEPFSPFSSLNGASKDADPNPVSDLSGNIDHSNFLQTTSLNDQQANETLVKLKDADLASGINSSMNTGLNEIDDGSKANVTSKLDVGLMNSMNINQSLNVLNDANDTHVPLENKQDVDKDVTSSMPNANTPVSQSSFSNNQIQFAVTGSSNQFTTAPLGSSQNPIRIIQQGNQFVSVQNLTQEQLAQVIQVVQQQQQQQRNNIQSNSTIQAQNKVIYKIVYPNQSNNNISSSNNNNNISRTSKTKKISDVISNSLANNRFIAASNNSHLFHPKKKVISTEATDVLMRLNKEQKKKHRPRTRSGRVSKPPQYMVKDYKHIHPVDYDEDYDDSDGGYSDFKMSSGDEDEERENKKSYYKDTHLALSSSKSKKFKCDYCEKSYIGRGGLNRHYRLNPSHGKPDDEDIGDSYYSSDSFQSGSIANTSDALVNFPSPFDHKSSKDGHHNDDDVTLSLEVDTNMGDFKQHGSDGYPDGLSRKGRRGRPPGANNGSGSGGPSGLSSAEKKKLRLIEVAKSCTDEDILDLFIQRCSSTVSLWKILMSKTTKLYDSSIDSLISEVSNLNEQVSTYLNEKLVPFVEEEEEENEDGGNHGTKNVFEMVDEKMAACLNVPIGKYIVKVDEYFEGSVQAEEPTIYQELNHMEPTSSHSTKDHLEDDVSRNISPHKDNVMYSKKIKHQDSDIPIPLPPRKRLKLTDLNQDADDFINEVKQSRKVVRFDNDDEEDSIDDNKSAVLASSSLTSPAADDDNDSRNVIDNVNKVLLTNNFDDITDDGSEFHVRKESDPNKEKRPLDFINIQTTDNPTSFTVESGLVLKNENDSNLMAAFTTESTTALAKEQMTTHNTSTTNATTTAQSDVANQQINLNTDVGNVPNISAQPVAMTNTENSANNFDHKIVTSLLQQLSQQQQLQQQQQQLQQHQQEIFNKSNIPQTLTNNDFFSNAIFQNDTSSNVAIMSNNNQLIAVTPFASVSDIQNQLQQQQLHQQLQLQMQQQKQQLEQQLLMQQQQLQQQLMQQQQSQLLQQQQLQSLQHQQPQPPQPPQQICVTCYPLQEYIQLQENAQYVQTEDGMVVVKNADGSYQIYGTITQNITVDLLESLFNSNNNNNININNNSSTNSNLNNLVNNI